MHFLKREIVLEAPADKVWDFLATPRNLNELTPPGLHFRILSELPDRMFEGLLISYEIRIPGFGTRSWLTEIKHVRDRLSFVDEQRLGPYRFWYHQHIIEAEGPLKTRMID